MEYEKLLSKDPIRAIEKIKDDYLRYFKTSYKLSDGDLDNEKTELYRQEPNLFNEPYLELQPEYAYDPEVESIDDLNNRLPEDLQDNGFLNFIRSGLMDYRPYKHQVEMLQKAVNNRQNVVITSGTGSGKTESFLLPLFASLYREKQSWPAPTYGPWNYYRKNTVYDPNQRIGETRPAAVRAIILYPMNALVEDQMERLRKALDSDAVRNLFDTVDANGNRIYGNRIYFGRYTGNTIGSKSIDILSRGNNRDLQNARESVRKSLGKLENSYGKVKDDPRSKYVTTRLEPDSRTSEMVTRWDMQAFPPDIMITNTSMLGVMLMREAEKDIFTKTKEWLNAIDVPENQREEAKRNRVFHIIVDELHLYRGTAGSEVGGLIRMLFRRLGLQPVINGQPNPQIRVLASSASLGGEEATQKFMEEFFGIYNTNGYAFEIQEGHAYEPDSNEELTLDYSRFDQFIPDNLPDEEQNYSNIDFERICYEQFGLSVQEFVRRYEGKIFHDFKTALPVNRDEQNRTIGTRPICVNDLWGTGRLFPTENSLRGFLIFRGHVDGLVPKNSHRLPRIRFHQFFKFVEGLWGELSIPQYNRPNSPISSLSLVPTEVGPNGRKMLELLRCECCGELFIGGERKIVENGNQPREFMTLNYPDLNQIPSFNPTPMVQNKNYRQYRVFWPQRQTQQVIGDLAVYTGNRRKDYAKVALIDSNDSPGINHAQANWTQSYLNVNTGEIVNTIPTNRDSWIEGFSYELVLNDINLADNIYASPCRCPKCGQNYVTRKYSKSPIRSFRAGIAKANQLLSKEIVYQLAEKSKQLIGFSDSREDAAKQALEIEKEQYRDMVRMLFVKFVDELRNISDEEFIQFVREQTQAGNNSRSMIRANVQQRFGNLYCADDVDDVLDGNPLPQRSAEIPLSQIKSSIETKLVELGINPAGWKKANQSFGDNLHWSKAYDFNTNQRKNGDYYGIGVLSAYFENVDRILTESIFKNSFGLYMGLSVQDAAIGYICCPRNGANNNHLAPLERLLGSRENAYEFVDSMIRVLGDNYRYDSSDFDSSAIYGYDNFDKMKKYVQRIAEDRNCSANELGNELWRFMLQSHIVNGVGFLSLENLAFKRVSDADHECYECPDCHRIHISRGLGRCTNLKCLGNLNGQDVIIRNANTIYQNHYIAFDILKEPRTTQRLHTEEISGQTDNMQERLLQFKNIIVSSDDNDTPTDIEGYRRTKPIDMVCVTTTMEVGVDIGSLQAIFQGNMPPTRYNYQQRVGRGGRRGQAFSAAFTFCRGRSHDVYYYYQATDEMVGGIPQAPKLSLAPYLDNDGSYKLKESIFKRVITKDILHEAFSPYALNYGFCQNADTSGEFGSVITWNTPIDEELLTGHQILNNWIQNHTNEIESIVGFYLNQFNLATTDITAQINEICSWIRESLLGLIDSLVDRAPDNTKSLSEWLSESGLLPMYGLPAYVRNFYHGIYEKWGSRERDLSVIDRPLEMSISELAPGSEKTKDKGIYRVEGLTVPLMLTPQINLALINPQNQDALEDRYVMQTDDDGAVVDIRPVTQQEKLDSRQNNNLTEGMNNDNDHILVIPQGYRTYRIIGNDGDLRDNDERASKFSQCDIFAKAVGEGMDKDVINVHLSLYENNHRHIGDCSEVWKINTNNNKFFNGRYYDDQQGVPAFMFYSNDGGSRITNEVDIAIGARKPTDMLWIKINNVNPNVDISLNTGNRSAIKAAAYSAASILQRELADEMDIDPNEIEISLKNDDGDVIIILNDAAPNGAGFVSHLYEGNNFNIFIERILNFETSFMRSILSDDHRDCLTSCQKCLNTYSNRGYHHVLDWRLGVGFLRLMMNGNYDFGWSDNNEDYPELTSEDRIINVCCAKLGIANNGENNKRIYHPLISRAVVLNQYPNTSLYNTFKVLRSDLTPDNQTRRPANRFPRRPVQQQTQQQAQQPVQQPAQQPNSQSDQQPPIILGGRR